MENDRGYNYQEKSKTYLCLRLAILFINADEQSSCCNKSNTTSDTHGTGNVCPFGAPGFTIGYYRGS